MNAITFLIREHDKVRRILSEISKKTRRFETKKALFNALCKDLIRHETMEQTIWYPCFKNNKRIKKEVRHLLSEEKSAEKAIKAIKKLEKIKTQEEWEDKFSKFKSDVEHHAHEEEYDLFPNVEAIMDEKNLEEIGKEMWRFKKKFKNKKLSKNGNRK